MFNFRHTCSILQTSVRFYTLVFDYKLEFDLGTSVRSETLVFDFGHQCSILDTVVRFETLTFDLRH